MKKLWLVVLAASFCLQLAAQTDSVYLFAYFRDNGQDGLHFAYSMDGLRFTVLKHDSSFLKPVISHDSLMRDPCVIRGTDGKFHMVWTVSWHERGIGYASSEDLVHWSEQQFIPVMAKEPAARNCWAPEITYDVKKKRYVIYWATTIPGRFPGGDPSVENGYNHRIYYTTTRDFKKFSETRLLYDQGFNVIDATIVYDGGRYVMILKDETPNPPQKNLRVATSKELTSGFSNPSWPITGNYWAEGPTMTRIGGRWVVYFDKYRDQRYGAVASDDLVKWEDISDQLRMPKGMRHGTILRVSKQELQRLQP